MLYTDELLGHFSNFRIPIITSASSRAVPHMFRSTIEKPIGVERQTHTQKVLGDIKPVCRSKQGWCREDGRSVLEIRTMPQ